MSEWKKKKKEGSFFLVAEYPHRLPHLHGSTPEACIRRLPLANDRTAFDETSHPWTSMGTPNLSRFVTMFRFSVHAMTIKTSKGAVIFVDTVLLT